MSEANPRVEEEQRYAPRQGLQELLAPLPGRISSIAIFRGFASLTLPAPSRAPGRPFQGAHACVEYSLPYL